MTLGHLIKFSLDQFLGITRLGSNVTSCFYFFSISPLLRWGPCWARSRAGTVSVRREVFFFDCCWNPSITMISWTRLKQAWQATSSNFSLGKSGAYSPASALPESSSYRMRIVSTRPKQCVYCAVWVPFYLSFMWVTKKLLTKREKEKSLSSSEPVQIVTGLL